MKISLIAIGKTDKSELNTLIDQYRNRLKHYVNFELLVIPDIKNVKNLSRAQQKQQEGQLILGQLKSGDRVILLDEKGKQLDSVGFSQFLQKQMNSGIKRLVFVIGGPYGYSEDVYQAAHSKLSLSAMTFSHQMVRLFFTEQLYRAFTILKNEPYHHR
ncbi:23S rRNA (pseudouridine(1915)-N(3))-methyltransferase RlmH [Aureitalea marina]|uniref:Ribosomal RNA large subunit methyltransferase H n=1 Tax=Aureitalea marina TaxID=930804 RepID=A0A2S7KPK7_9FLAO|nr:23S rRNA (pseudouridine(1915)-N(3))-methyltransferase RlmH [Aureitalea marina]PQB04555.1 23S rRNA (pseudouridine(1915)-N(3))-methyltransferase RlmH [Aureitalea marina]